MRNFQLWAGIVAPVVLLALIAAGMFTGQIH